MKKDTKMNINLYLLKNEVKGALQVLKDSSNGQVLNGIDGGAVELYYKNTPELSPNWVKKIMPFCQLNKTDLTSSSCSVVLLVKPNNLDRYFALCFGYGRNLLDIPMIEDNFGLKVALNVIDHEKVKSIDVKNLDTVVKNVKMDNSKETDFGSFGTDIERDILGGVVGIRKNIQSFKYARTIHGKDSVKFSSLIDIKELPSICCDLFRISELKDYQEHFRWIDYVKIVRNDKKLICDLDQVMIDLLHKNNVEKVWMCLPEIIDWYDKDGFSYTPNGSLYEDICMEECLKERKKNAGEITLEFLKNGKVYYHRASDNQVYLHWSIYNCIYCEVDNNEQRYILVGGNWHAVDKKYSKDIDEQLRGIKEYEGSCDFILYNRIREEDYNKGLYERNKTKSILFDHDMILHGGSRSSVEFCDLYYDKKEFIHVKRYSGSSTLSHLFFQGLTPAYLLKTDKDFRNKVNDKLKAVKHEELPESLDSSNYEIVYAIASKDNKKNIRDILPFFSKVTLVHIANQLKSAYGFKVSLKKILLDEGAIEKERIKINDKKKEKSRKTEGK